VNLTMGRITLTLAALPAFRATADPSTTLSSSTAFPVLAGYTAYLAPALSRWDEEGFSSCSACPVSPCCPYHPAEVFCGVSQAAAGHTAFVPDERTRPSDWIFLEATGGFTHITAR
jgi:hypothetical protein